MAAIREAPADPTADVEQSYAGRDAEAVKDVLARRRTSGVQLVDRKQVRGPEVLGVDSQHREALEGSRWRDPRSLRSGR